jgi:hypothetical protein
MGGGRSGIWLLLVHGHLTGAPFVRLGLDPSPGGEISGLSSPSRVRVKTPQLAKRMDE